MIRPFEYTDARRLKANKFSGVGNMGFVFSDETFYKHTLVDQLGDVQCIICFKKYWQDNYMAFFLMSDTMKPLQARELKAFVHTAIIDLNAKRVQTQSVACELLDRWHKFLEFELEGTLKRFIEGRDYRSWAIVRE